LTSRVLAFTRRALWSFLVGSLAALPAMSGLKPAMVRDAGPVAPALPSAVKTEAAPLPETRRVLAEIRRTDDVDDAPARAAAPVTTLPPRIPVLAEAERAAVGAPAADPDSRPLSRRALGPPRARAPDSQG
jgi:hypothetical protein